MSSGPLFSAPGVSPGLGSSIQTMVRLLRSLEGRGHIYNLGGGYPNPQASSASRYVNHARRYFSYLARQRGVPESRLYAEMGTYSRPREVVEALARVYGHDIGVSIDPRYMMTVFGSTGGFDLLCRLFESEGEKVAYITEAPSYTGFIDRALSYQKAKLFSVDMDREGPDPEMMRAQIRAARAAGYFVAFYYTVPDGHNPTGITFSQRRRAELYKVAQEENILIVEDNPYWYLTFSDAPERTLPFLSIDTDKRVIHLFTTSKIGLAGQRLGFLYAPMSIQIAGDEVKEMHSLLFSLSVSQSLLVNPMALRSFEAMLHKEDPSGDFRPRKSLRPIGRRRAAIYQENRNILLGGLEVFNDREPGLCAWTVPHAGFFTMLTFHATPGRLPDSVELARRLLEKYSVMTIPARDLYPPDAWERDPGIGYNQLRLAFSQTIGTGEERRRELREGVAAFCEAIFKELS